MNQPHIVWNRLVNCQSHEDTLLEFNEGLNVIVARNSTGKSVFFKMLELATAPDTYTSDEIKSLNRTGSTGAISLYGFSDGYVGGVQVINENKLVHLGSEDYENEGLHKSNQPFPELLDRLSVIVDESTKFFANILDQAQALLFVKSASKSNNNLVKMVVSDDRMDKLLLVLPEKIKAYTKRESRLSALKYDLEYRISRSNYINLEQLEAEFSYVDTAIDVLEPLIDGIRDLEVLSRVNVDTEDYDTILFACDLLLETSPLVSSIKYIENIEADLELFDFALELASGVDNSIKYIDTEENEILSLCDQLYGIMPDVAAIKMQEDLEPVLELVDMFSEIVSGFSEVISLARLEETIALRKVEIETLEKEYSLLGEEVQCPIFGRIRHVGNACIPLQEGSRVIDHRLALG